MSSHQVQSHHSGPKETCGPKSHVGAQDKALDQANAKGWISTSSQSKRSSTFCRDRK
jgi:hypothetical protein